MLPEQTSSGNNLEFIRSKQESILQQFSPAAQNTIQYRQQILSSLAYFIGKDFNIPVDLNEPGAGWHWDFGANKIRIDPNDLVEKPMDFLRFVISHEGGHRRISRMDNIPMDVWRQPGFAFMMNAIEDPRTNNFIAEAYPRFKDQMELAYKLDQEFEAETKKQAKDELGQVPRFVQAGLEYIRQWFNEAQDKELTFGDDLPTDVKETVSKTLPAAKDSWLRYPSRIEADQGEALIRKYAGVSYEINRDEIWPEFKKLVEEDMKDQEMQELLKDMQQQGQSGSEGEQQEGDSGKASSSQNLKDSLTPQEQKQLEEAIEQAVQKAHDQQEQASDGHPSNTAIVDLDSLPESLKQKIKEYIESLPEDIKKQLAEKAKAALKEFEDNMNESLEGKLTDNPEKKSSRAPSKDATSLKDEKPGDRVRDQADKEGLREIKDKIEEILNKDENIYEKYRRAVLPIIDALEQDLRELFVQRRAQKWMSGFKSGKKIDIKRRIQEKAKGIPVVESRAWKKRELPQEKDYAISLLVDLSGSMQGSNIRETFKGAIVLAEVLNRLSIPTEILGFNDHLYEYQAFGQPMSQDIRGGMGTMLGEVNTNHAQYNDDGWALQQTSGRLAKQQAQEKFVFVLSDGIPAESAQHPRSKYDLPQVVKHVMEETDQKLIGLGIGSDTQHVESYYPNSIANINVSEMAEKLADLLREVIANYDTF